jgi:hypothetical protein
MAHAPAQKSRIGYGPQPTPERHVYIEAARKHHPTRHAWRLSIEEVRQIRAMSQSDAVLYTIAAHFSIPRREVGLVARRPFESQAQAEDRADWLRDEVNAAHREAIALQVDKDWTEAKREDKRRAKATEKATRPEGSR